MSVPVILDFAMPRVRTTVAGMALLIVGMSTVTFACLEYRAVAQKRAGLELRLADAVHRASHTPADAARAEHQNEEATGLTRELGTPWTGVLADLEAASQASADEIAVLAIEPDHDKHRILIKAEAKTLPLALTYLKRLQESKSLRFPMLDSHETVVDDKDHPVRIAMTADWQEGP
jgi:hypothetical protein